jgi:hypothetical protein
LNFPFLVLVKFTQLQIVISRLANPESETATILPWTLCLDELASLINGIEFHVVKPQAEMILALGFVRPEGKDASINFVLCDEPQSRVWMILWTERAVFNCDNFFAIRKGQL